MTTIKNIKIQLHQHLKNQVAQKIALLEGAIQSAEMARDKETKSSVGDKYETGRAMMQQEIFRKREQLQQALETRLVLSTIKPAELHSTIQLGSLVKTTNSYFFISVGAGKVQLGEDLYFAISKQSPIGKILLGKKKGETVLFRGKQLEIKQVL